MLALNTSLKVMYVIAPQEWPRNFYRRKENEESKVIVLNTIVYGLSWDLDMILDMKQHVSCYSHILTKFQIYKH